jgi:hypothetical protein
LISVCPQVVYKLPANCAVVGVFAEQVDSRNSGVPDERCNSLVYTVIENRAVPYTRRKCFDCITCWAWLVVWFNYIYFIINGRCSSRPPSTWLLAKKVLDEEQKMLTDNSTGTNNGEEKSEIKKHVSHVRKMTAVWIWFTFSSLHCVENDM